MAASTEPATGEVRAELERILADESFAHAGRASGVIIELERGSYIPRFGYADRTQASAARSFPAKGTVLGFGAGIISALAVLFAVWFWWPGFSGLAEFRQAEVAAGERGTAPDRTAGMLDDIDRMPPRLVILPIADFSGDQEIEGLAAGLTEELNSAFVAFNIIASISPNVGSSSGIRFRELREEFRAGYALLASIRAGGGQLRLILRAIDTKVGTQFWTLTIDGPLDGELIGLQRRIALRIAQMISSPFGPVFAHEMDRIAKLPSGQLNPFQCLVRFYDYARSFDPALHAESVACMQRVTSMGPGFAAGWSSLATLYLHEHNFGYTVQPDKGASLERALEAARTALDIDAGARVGTIALAGIYRAQGDAAQFQGAVARGLAIEPPHPAALAQLGFQLILNGEPGGRKMIDQAIEATVQVPGWYYIAHSFAALQEGRYEEALSWAGRIDAPNWFAAPMAFAAAAAWANRPDIARREIRRLREIYPDIEDRGRAQLGRWLINQQLRDKLIDGLRLAGLELS